MNSKCPKCGNEDFWTYWSDLEHEIEQKISLPASCECGCSFTAVYSLILQEVKDVEYAEEEK